MRARTMLIHVRSGLLSSRKFGQEIISRIAEMLHENKQRYRNSIEFNLVAGDERLTEIRRLLNESGFSPFYHFHWAQGNPQSMVYHERFEIVLTKADLDSAEYLRLVFPPDHDLASAFGNAKTNTVYLYADEAKNQGDRLGVSIGPGTAGACPAVSDRTRRLVEPANLRGLVFRPAVPLNPDDNSPAGTDPDDPWKGVCEPFWAVDSEYELPPLPEFVELRDYSSDRYAPVLNRGVQRDDRMVYHPLIINPPLRYTREQINAIPPFDIARTFEWFRPSGSRFDAHFVVSQNFRQSLEAAGITAGYFPVMISEDGTDPFRPEEWADLPVVPEH